jgi:methylglutaconyl-CoA hydratase
MSEPALEIETADGIATVWLNRPDLRNAFDENVIAALHSAFESLATDTGVRAVVLAGRGTAFCAGADLNWMKKMAGFSVEENRADAMALARMLQRIHSLPKPTIARVHGAAFAGGMGLLCACDIAIASTEAQFRLSEVRLGLTPATISPYVINAIGERQARRYFLTAEAFDAAEALRIGLVHETVAPAALDERVANLAAQLVQGSPAALAASKQLIDAVARAPLDDALIADTAVRIAQARASAEGKEGVSSFLEKRRPAWLAAVATKGPERKS